MKLSGSRYTMGLTALLVGAATVVLAIGGGDHAIAGAATTPTGGVTAGPSQIVVQVMDSCKSGLDGAVFELVNSTGGHVASVGSHTPGAQSHPGSISTSSPCPLQQGDCVTTGHGCLVFQGLPDGDYRLKETVTPGPNNTNKDGYAPCNSGSACLWQTADITISGNGSSILGAVTNAAPTGQIQQFPNAASGHATYYLGTPADPIVFHNFGLCKPGACSTPVSTASPNPGPGVTNPPCDGPGSNRPDGSPAGDADDWSTGTPGSNCSLTQALEASTCPGTAGYEGTSTVFPWQCMSNPVATPLHLQMITLSGPSSVTALSTFQVNVSNGTTPTLVSAQDPGMVATPNPSGFAVSLSPVRTAATGGKHPTAGGQITTGTVTISPQGGQGNSLTISVSPPSGNANFIENLYHDVLGRYGQPDEIGYWSSRMDGGMTSGDVASTFSMTPEFLGSLVDTDYQWMVGSTPAANDPGRQYWVSFLSQGNRLDTMTGMLGASDAYFAQAGGTDAGFITSLYAKVLHRPAPPAPSEVAYWSQFGPFAHNSMARLQVANDMAFSHEQHMLLVSGWYQKFLGRAPEFAGQTYWADRLDTGTLPQVLVPSFTNGPEYYGLTAKY
jgi:hypothetical protein